MTRHAISPPCKLVEIVDAATAAELRARYGLNVYELPQTTGETTTIAHDTEPCPPWWIPRDSEEGGL